ncbi:MAG: spermidine synthase [Sneathiella sp.]|jgi:spermidine synthase|uniref:polyamine aminopropyltransferase n=1 Tax=Sneathiella sp. TaxID=1964365 RepID=UPI000C4B2F43|nr:polyamine aminopropyltransferase [Sneathiella sp.]MAL77651.1 spermidine synthase [Sneathiella sp.]|tara:strand:- start:85 stop:936 length:852 start_codon:yes stop_codon:yes gene_type:complete
MELFDEGLHSGVNLALSVDKVLYREQTDLQDLMIFENKNFGRVMSLDGSVQTTEKDEFIYHEMFVHVPMLAHGRARRALIIGGGDGGAARQLMKYSDIAVTMVDIDRTVVELSKKYMPSVSGGAFDDPRFNLVIADGCKFVKETGEQWDVIIIDSTDPHGPGEVLYTEEFYSDCKSCLTPGGVIITQNGVPFVQEAELRTSYDRLGRLFRDVSFYLAAIPSYVGGVMAYGWATDDVDLRKTGLAELAARYMDAGITTDYYTPEVHQAAFALPLHIQKALTKEG